MLRNAIRVITVTLLALFCVTGAYAEMDNEGLSISDLKKGVVNIENRIVKSAYSRAGNFRGTGFLLDKKQGIILTNNHVAPSDAVQEIVVVFFNGKEAEAKVLYNDPLQDFAFLKISINDIPDDVAQLELSNDNPGVGQNVFIVGNNQGKGFSFHDGVISNIYDASGNFVGQNLTISLNARGGSSGSPVFGENGKVLGIAFGGSDTYLLASPVQYIRDAFKYINQGKRPIRKDIGATISYVSLDKIVQYNNFPREVADGYIKKYENSNNLVVYVKDIPLDSPAHGILEPGDVIWKVNEEEIGPGIYQMQKAINELTEKKIKISVYRKGKLKNLELTVYDLEKTSIKRMLLFGGSVFYEADEEMRLITGAKLGSVFLSTMNYDSCFLSLPVTGIGNSYSQFVNIAEINGVSVNSLDGLIKEVKNLVGKKDKFSVHYKNFGYTIEFDNTPIFSNLPREEFIQCRDYGSDPVLLRREKNSQEWVSEKIMLSK